ncbi:hypothetical protein SBDP2_1710013 [Syntrophobacter sp. SbD2]|nr:hypothetical protein SBDP2_1710013 [Syntrophobacter sp. SbD2]
MSLLIILPACSPFYLPIAKYHHFEFSFKGKPTENRSEENDITEQPQKRNSYILGAFAVDFETDDSFSCQLNHLNLPEGGETMRRGLMVAVLFLFTLLVAGDRTALAGYRIIHEFDGTDGFAPYGHLISVGHRLYGMTAGDSIDNKGMVFSLTSDGSDFTVLHHFAGQPGDGEWPQGSLFYQGDTLYGITWAGGCSENNCLNPDNNGCGTLFSLRTNGSNYKVFWEFSCGGADLSASLPYAHFVSDGRRLYSTAELGGEFESGAVFAVRPDGTGFTILHSFSGSDGNQPAGGLALENGILYGTTFSGGDNNLGTVFSIGTNGSNFKVLHHFGGSDGEQCFSTPILAYNRIFGATAYGGVYNQGVIFSMRPDGADYQILHSFTENDSGPHEGVILVGDKLYGATTNNGPTTFGVIYSLGLDGSQYTVWHRFDYNDGSWVRGRLLLLGNTLFGLASHGGQSGNGLVFAFDLPRPPTPPCRR